jgi:hypothetical protein
MEFQCRFVLYLRDLRHLRHLQDLRHLRELRELRELRDLRFPPLGNMTNASSIPGTP